MRPGDPKELMEKIPDSIRDEYKSVERALGYLAFADRIPHRTEGEAALLAEVPLGSKRVLDLGTGDGRLLSLVLIKCPGARGVALDFSPPLLEKARERFAQEGRVEVVEHDMNDPLPELGGFDVVCSSFAIHHVPNERKRELYSEIWRTLLPGGVFCNLEHVDSPTPGLHARFLEAMGIKPDEEDRSNILLDVETQLRWLREIGFEDVDCLWKWRELALIKGDRSIQLNVQGGQGSLT